MHSALEKTLLRKSTFFNGCSSVVKQYLKFKFIHFICNLINRVISIALVSILMMQATTMMMAILIIN